MTLATNLGFPRIGAKREVKKALDDYWAGRIGRDALLDVARRVREENWRLQVDAGIEHVPSNDFSLYDHVLDTVAMTGAVPERFGTVDGTVGLDTYFAMARGTEDAHAMEMTKWFDTNYHYIVPELHRDQEFRLASTQPVDAFKEAQALGVHTRPVLLGPVSFLLLGKAKDNAEPLELLNRLLPVYEEVLRALAEAGADWVQLDEPSLSLDLEPEARSAFATAYRRLRAAAPNLRILVATYFEGLRENRATALGLPVDALHVDLVRAPDELAPLLEAMPDEMILSVGVVDGRNVWRADLQRAYGQVARAAEVLGPERVFVAPSCSLLHGPVDLDLETELDDLLKSWLAFGKQKLDEVCLLAQATGTTPEAVSQAFTANTKTHADRREATRVHDPDVKARSARVTETMRRRASPYPDRHAAQAAHLRLPAFPTTTIGSFPQTREVRAARAAFKRGEMTREAYEKFLSGETEACIRFQEDVGLDVLVHGEFERNDMVEFFGEKLDGFAFTKHGWVQSYGSRCVKPPLIYGDVKRSAPMTVDWATFSQSLTRKPVKGMLTGPVTILQWSFVRDDQPREETCRQIALAIRDEVQDLEAAGIRVIQVDEPALREGLPLRQSDWKGYLEWAVNAFRLATAGVRDETQVHTHMCYAEFDTIMEAVAAMDADVISMEASRSQMDLLEAFRRDQYPNEIGPGVFDVHSPRVPGAEEMAELLERALPVIPAARLWVNPDCGLKTRGWAEVRPALENMVAAAARLRETSGGDA